MVDAHASEACIRKNVEVQVLSMAPAGNLACPPKSEGSRRVRVQARPALLERSER